MAMKLGLVLPCYNEEEGLDETTKRLEALYNELIEKSLISQESFICYVDDGSKDKTWEHICKAKEQSSYFKGIKLSRNFGHQNALLAGLMQMKNEADALISMDADLQDDIGLVESFIEKYNEGFEVIYGVRNDRSTDTGFKKHTAQLFYKFQHAMGVESVYNHADYRLLSSRALETLSTFKEVNLFLRGMVPLLGFRSCSLYYKRAERFAGETKYPLKKMLLFALNGITSFSVVPLRLITIVGVAIFLLSLFAVGWVVVNKLFFDNAITGWSSTIASIYLIGGIEMISLGIIGEYVGRILLENKARPRFIIEEEI